MFEWRWLLLVNDFGFRFLFQVLQQLYCDMHKVNAGLGIPRNDCPNSDFPGLKAFGRNIKVRSLVAMWPMQDCDGDHYYDNCATKKTLLLSIILVD